MRIAVGIILILIGYFIWTNDARYRKEKSERNEMTRFDSNHGGLIVQLLGIGLIIAGVVTFFGGD